MKGSNGIPEIVPDRAFRKKYANLRLEKEHFNMLARGLSFQEKALDALSDHLVEGKTKTAAVKASGMTFPLFSRYLGRFLVEYERARLLAKYYDTSGEVA